MSSYPRFNRPQAARVLTAPGPDKAQASVGLSLPLPVPEVTYVAWSEWILATAPFSLQRSKANPATPGSRAEA